MRVTIPERMEHGTDRVVTDGFHGRVYAVVRTIPPGFVTTYGDVAAALGSPRVARHVGWALAALRDPDVPWHRVINAKGMISGRGDTGRAALQESRLRDEGIAFDPQGRVLLAQHRYDYADLANTSSE